MKIKTIRKQIMVAMIGVILIYFAISMGYSMLEYATLNQLMDGEMEQAFDLMEQVLEGANPDDPAVQMLMSDEYYDGILKHVDESLNKLEVGYIAALVLVIVISFLYSRRMSNRIVNPIVRLEEQMKAVGEGHLDQMVRIENAPEEIEGLANCFNSMTTSLQEYIRQLTQTTSDKNRLSMELTLMRQIQANMLPSRYPTLNNVMMHADVWRFSEIGVAYYDFFPVDESRLALIVGDVTDQGVMATLFAVMSQNFIRGFAKMGYAPSRILSETNNLLSEKNEFGLNVAVTVVVIDHMTGEIAYAMAGGEPPILRQAGSAAKPVSDQMTIPLGNMENVGYHTYKTRLAQGDTLAVYSHGVVEAKNAANESFGAGRLAEAIEARLGYELSEASEEIRSRIHTFTGGAAQAEDGIMLLLRYLG
ncbi:MAG: SpoIIE family protein phosphatase [Lachnospiraceae bacterium]|nr:SpoIIE family protein phosphatase [Lachnospiraceae bacterium]